MTTINQITHDHIGRLTDLPFTELLSRLLSLEAIDNNLPLSGVSVPLKITVPDGGKDGEIKWSSGISKTEWLPSNNICFQVKATKMSKNACKKEILKNEGTKQEPIWKLKEEVKKCLDEGGAYILFLKQDLVPKDISSRVKKIREGIEEAGESYYKTANIKIYDGNKIASWVNRYPSIVSFVCGRIGLSQTIPLKTFDDWKRTEGEFFANNFITSEKTRDHCEQIRNAARESGVTLRITGLSGLGKSRMIFQAFEMNEKSELESKMLKSSVLYYDASDASSGFVDHVANLCKRKAKCNLIIDNCTLQLHKSLRKELRDTNFNLITTDSNPDAQNELSQGEVQIKVFPEDFIDIIPDILADLFPRIEKHENDRIALFAQGFPLIAVLLAKQLLEGSQNIGQLTEESIIDKLLGISSDDKETRYVLRAVSLFDHFGFYDEYIDQRNFIATNKLLIPLTCDAEIAKSRFKEICERYISRGIIEVKGRKVFLKPKPLALRLAREWWESFQEDRLSEILDSVSENGLATQLCDQIAKLDFVPKAQELTEKLCGPSGPFGKAEVLNTKQGSRLFRSLVEVNPQATANCLERVFATYSIEKLKGIDKGRRNLVWALEKLCFRNDTFDRAAKIMLAFAAAENETWGNNATAQFLQLFHIYLAGTAADLQMRIRVIEFALSKKEDKYRQLGISAIGRGFKTSLFSRMGGAEKQGSGKGLTDYKPNHFEIVEYWTNLKSILINDLITDELYHDKAKKILANAIFDLSIVKSISIILPEVKTVIKKEGGKWPDVLSSLKRTLKYKKINLTQEEQDEVKYLIEKLEPTDLDSLYTKTIAEPTLEDFEQGGKNISQKIRDRAEDFVKKFFGEIDDIGNYISIFYKGRQQEGYFFGTRIAQEMRDKSSKRQFIITSLNHFRSTNIEEINPIVLAGFLNFCSKEIIQETLDILESDPILFRLSFSIARNIEIDSKQIDKLFNLIDKHEELNIGAFQTFRFSRALNKLSYKDTVEFCNKLIRYNNEGIWMALSLIESYCYDNLDKWMALKTTTKKILALRGVLKVDNISIRIDAHSWESLTKKILLCDNDYRFARHIAKEIVFFCDTIHYNFGLDAHIKNVLLELLEKYFHHVWPIFGSAILSKNKKYIIFFHFQYLIGPRFGFEEGILFQKGDHDVIFEWVKTNKGVAPRRIANLMPTLNIKEGYSWHPFAKRVIDEFGSDKEVLNELNSNLGSYSWSGSSVPLYKGKKKAFQEFLNHPIDNVRLWAKNQIEYCEKRIKQETIEDEERYL